MRDPDRQAPNAAVAARQEVAAGILRLAVRPDGGVPAFEAGQYFALGRRMADGRLVQRPYSTASGPEERETLEFLVRRVEGGALTPELWGLGVGDRLRIGPPRGLFTLLPLDSRHHLFVSTGTGLAPFLSMLHALDRRPGPPPVTLVHGVARAADLAYRDRLQAWPGRARVRYLPTVSRPADPANAGWAGAIGRVDAVLARGLPTIGASPDDLVAYVCGNPGMVEAVRAVLLAHGLAPDAIRAEEYWVEGSARAA